jgi:hypothetical protein
MIPTTINCCKNEEFPPEGCILLIKLEEANIPQKECV